MKTKEELKNEFDRFVKDFDFNEYKIELKYHHSYRVADICEYLAVQMKDEYSLNDEDIKLAYLIGLLHDIARFEQFTKFHTFSDLESIDHGDFGKRILESGIIRSFITEKDYDDIILQSVKWHNKFEIEDVDKYTDKELFFMKLIRDADKLDIFYEMVDDIINLTGVVYGSEFTPIILENFNLGYMTPIRHEQTSDDKFIRFISFVYDINYAASFKYLYEKDYINKIINKLDIKEEAKPIYEKLRNKANEHVKEKMCN